MKGYEMGKQRAVFFDRDGTINVDVGYLASLDRLILYPAAYEAIRRVNEGGMKAVVVTNQSGVARGYFDEAFVCSVHERINVLLETEGAHIDRFYFCPHHPEEGMGQYRVSCSCRKPQPGMLLQAARDMHIDLERSYMIGDMGKDVEAACNAGAQGILLGTGPRDVANVSCEPVYVARDVLDAVQWIFKDQLS